mgnify:CR=1 FL=1
MSEHEVASAQSMKTRLEHDLIGDRQVPDHVYYGIHTLRALENFPVTGTPISIYPDLIKALASIKQALNDRIRLIEELQHQAQVLRESAVLLGQRSEVLASKSWQEAWAQRDLLGQDVARWQAQCEALTQDKEWSCVDPKFAPALQTNSQQVRAVFEAFSAALNQAQAAALMARRILQGECAWAWQGTYGSPGA